MVPLLALARGKERKKFLFERDSDMCLGGAASAQPALTSLGLRVEAGYKCHLQTTIEFGIANSSIQ